MLSREPMIHALKYGLYVHILALKLGNELL